MVATTMPSMKDDDVEDEAMIEPSVNASGRNPICTGCSFGKRARALGGGLGSVGRGTRTPMLGQGWCIFLFLHERNGYVWNFMTWDRMKLSATRFGMETYLFSKSQRRARMHTNETIQAIHGPKRSTLPLSLDPILLRKDVVETM